MEGRVEGRVYRVLLSDSRPVFRQGLRTLFERNPAIAVVGEACGLSDTLAQARELQPDVLLLDLHSTDFDAWPVIAQVHAQVPQVKIVVLAAASTDLTFAFQVIRAGVRGLVLHDTDVDTLVNAICLVAQGQAVLAPEPLLVLLNELPDLKPAPSANRVDQLTLREREILTLLAQGATNNQIAERLVVSPSTVRSHVHHLLDKLGVESRAQAVLLTLSSDGGADQLSASVANRAPPSHGLPQPDARTEARKRAVSRAQRS